MGSREHLYDCRTVLSLDKNAYSVGDSIILTVEIIPEGTKVLTLFNDLEHSVLVSHVSTMILPKRSGTTTRHQFSPTEPLELRIEGSIERNSKGVVVLDFGSHGRVLLSQIPYPYFYVKVYPARIGWLDSVEWSASNHVELRIRDIEQASGGNA